MSREHISRTLIIEIRQWIIIIIIHKIIQSSKFRVLCIFLWIFFRNIKSISSLDLWDPNVCKLIKISALLARKMESACRVQIRTELVAFDFVLIGPRTFTSRDERILPQGSPVLWAPNWGKLNPDFKWNSYIRPIAKDARKIVGSLYRSSKYLTAPVILYL